MSSCPVFMCETSAIFTSNKSLEDKTIGNSGRPVRTACDLTVPDSQNLRITLPITDFLQSMLAATVRYESFLR
ncbi:7509_t:CDS:2 [Ambispora gerdemannii]|uniref:7509_t:CDS:1 n=1 Tax=Ambispora gerdemannii TaxID=144530 RepID=A0A9N9BEB3_9GLOM|nr:7509_t:CDS:2 [Ambispora gerdemannii]